MFNSRYESLLTDFESSKKLIEFFKNSSEKFFGGYDHTYDNWFLEISDIHGTVSINQALEKFMSTIFNAMALELEKRDKLLVANDDEYFFDVAKKIEKLKNSDPEEYKKALEELEKDSRTCETSKKLQITLPSYWRDLAMEYAKLQDKHPIEAVTEPVKVFPTASSPSPAEVKQAFIGDCYLMGSLIALAKNNKKAIKDCFVQGLDKIEKEKNIIIRFFGYKEGTRKKIKISVDKNKIIFPKGITALWPKLIEKAYAIYRKEGHEYGLADSDNLDFKSNRIRNSLEGGNPLDVMIAITGNKPHSSDHDHKDKSKFDPTRVMETIEKKLKSGHSLTCNFRRRFKTKDVKNAETITVYNNHCYAIVGIDRTKKYIRLIEPNKVLGRTYPAKSIGTDKLKPVKDGGHIAMCFDDFKNNFNRIRYTGKKKFL